MSVELGEGDDRASFEADVLDFTRAGASMRAPYLPEIGAQLGCRFRCGASGTEVSARAEVVWAQLDGERSGEFGLAFVDLDPDVEWVIEEMLAAPIGRRDEDPEPDPITQLELEGSAEPISARLARHEIGSAVFEQHLDLLSLGRGVRARAPGARDRSGRIGGVELRMVGNVPMLAVTVDFEHEKETSPGELHSDALDPNLPHDTVADVMAPPWAAAGALDENPPHSTTLTEFRLNERAAARRGSPLRRAANDAQPSARESPTEFAIEAAGATREDVTAEIAPQADSALQVRLHAWMAPLHAWSQSQREQLTERLAGVRLQWQQSLVRVGSDLRDLYHNEIGTRVGAVRRLVLRRRRTTAGPGLAKRPPARAPSAHLALGAAAVLAGCVLVYAWVRHAEHQVSPSLEVSAEPAAAVEAPPMPDPAAATPTNSEPALAGLAARPVPPPRRRVAVGSPVGEEAVSAVAEGVPLSAPTIAAASRPEPQARSAKPHFGAAQLPRGPRFPIRMSAPVQVLSGTARADGFTLAIGGAQSLDPAAPLVTRYPELVAKAKIRNQPAGAQLEVQFVKGKQPLYQVSADASTLYITLRAK